MTTRIDQNASLQYLATRSLSESQTAEQRSAPTSSAAAQDKVSLSAESGRVAALIELAENTPEIDSQRVQELKASVDSGAYPIDTQALAQRILATDRLLDR